MTQRMRSGLAQTFPLLIAYAKPDRLDLRRERRAPGTRVPPSRSLWSATLPFRDHGRAFDALVYLRGEPSTERLEQVAAILARLDFRPGIYLDPPGLRGRGSPS